LEQHSSSQAELTVVAYSEPTRHDVSGVLNPVGIYVVNRRALELVPARGFSDIKEHLVPRLYHSGARVLVHHTSGPIPRVLDGQSYLAVNAMAIECLVDGRAAPAGYVLKGETMVHADATVTPDAVLAGPILIGPGAQIRAGAVVIGPTSIGTDAVINEGALVSRSAVWRRSSVAAGTVLDSCILGDGALSTTDPPSSRWRVAPIRWQESA
jgi:mannose-1-phosphate guanylyltransferase/phosphomannomutase